MFKFIFSKALSPRPKTYYDSLKEMFAIVALSFLSDNGNVFTSCKREYQLAVFINLE